MSPPTRPPVRPVLANSVSRTGTLGLRVGARTVAHFTYCEDPLVSRFECQASVGPTVACHSRPSIPRSRTALSTLRSTPRVPRPLLRPSPRTTPEAAPLQSPRSRKCRQDQPDTIATLSGCAVSLGPCPVKPVWLESALAGDSRAMISHRPCFGRARRGHGALGRWLRARSGLSTRLSPGPNRHPGPQGSRPWGGRPTGPGIGPGVGPGIGPRYESPGVVGIGSTVR
jgi:hypothetical protein